MAAPTPQARAALDSYIKALAALGSGLSLDDFRPAQIVLAQRTARRVRAYILLASIVFMALAVMVLGQASGDPQVSPESAHYDMSLAALWAIALGGLGAAASIFLHILKLMPQETLKSADEFEVVGRLVLGCLFGAILAMTLVAPEMSSFFKTLRGGKDIKGGVALLLPFLSGYSISLVLGLLQKAIRAIELTIGLDDPREGARPRKIRGGGP